MSFRDTRCLILGFALVLAGVSVAKAQDLPSSVFPENQSQSGQGDNKVLPPKQAAKACLTTANEMLKNGYSQEAIALYERARQLDPSQKQVSRYLAVLYDEAGSDAKAMAEYKLALQLTPKDPDLLSDQGYFYFERRDLAAAEQSFRAAIAQSPRHERAWMNLAMLLGQEGRYEDCFNAFCNVVSPAAAHSNVGMIFAKQNRRQEAMIAFHRALELDPNLKQPRAVLAYLENPPRTSAQTAQRPADSIPAVQAGQNGIR